MIESIMKCTIPALSKEHAHKIMGKNFFGIEEAIKYFGISPTHQQLAILSEIPFSKTILEILKDTHILVAVFPLSIPEICDKVERKLFYAYEDAWHKKQSLEHGEIGWQLVRKTPVEDSFWKVWNEQKTLLRKNEKIPTAQIMVYTIIGYYLSTGERLFKQECVRTSTLDLDGWRVNVGYFYIDGLSASYYWDTFRYNTVGISSMIRKLNSET